MGSKVLDTGTLRRRLHHVPDRLGCDSIAPDLTQVTDTSEDDTIDAGSGSSRELSERYGDQVKLFELDETDESAAAGAVRTAIDAFRVASRQRSLYPSCL